MTHRDVVARMSDMRESLANARLFEGGHGPELAQAMAQGEIDKQTRQLP